MLYLLYLLYTCLGFSCPFCRWGVGYRFSPFTHFSCIYHEWDPKTPGLKKV